ncbi:hypothetical protein P154DRAFT_593486 [Amniculicola lignicola CBS 123094]|uniref:Probable double zinc ribbon domain-containing protein n=1 Tax=Amniculicola lignicola CBS 123094 TaxID=1392246 RepID=A0A6A5VTQ3_9PLEO|nr:hypothetical protein P154DRAFT_593486 [Amniculicola lignicola CBS 123094]
MPQNGPEELQNSEFFFGARVCEVEDNLQLRRAEAVSRIAYETLTMVEPDEDSSWRCNRLNADGVWHCYHCGHTNTVVHIFGPHPFGRLTCGKCNKLWAADNVSTNVIRCFRPMSREFAPVSAFGEKVVPYGQMCSFCGLTFRAVALFRQFEEPGEYRLATVAFPSGLACLCGTVSSKSWIMFHIGDNSDYRHGDPEASAARALERRLGFRMDEEAAVALKPLPKPPDCPETLVKLPSAKASERFSAATTLRDGHGHGCVNHMQHRPTAQRAPSFAEHLLAMYGDNYPPSIARYFEAVAAGEALDGR